MNYIVQVRNFFIYICQNGIINSCFLSFIDIFNLIFMRFCVIYIQGNNFDFMFVKFWFEFGNCV